MRTINMFRENTANNKLGEIFVTLDSHHKKHIAHKSFWSDLENDVNNKGTEPPDYTVVTEKNLQDGDWYPKDCSLQVNSSSCMLIFIYTAHVMDILLSLTVELLLGVHKWLGESRAL